MLDSFKATLSLLLCYGVDFIRFIRESQLISPHSNQEKCRAHILRIAHALEKGMAMPTPREGFGMNKASELINHTKMYITKWGADTYSDIAEGSIRALLNYHAARGIDVSKQLEMLTHLPATSIKLQCGTKTMTAEEIRRTLPPDAENFFHSRYSIRQFSDGIIPDETLQSLAKIAAKTPSVCNRQSCKVYFFNNPSLIQSVLSLQDGNAGFGNTAGAIAVITTDISCFYKAGERYQGHVDGGLFAMSLVYGAHALGLGSCMLNWSQATRTDQRLRQRLRLPDSEIVVTLIAFGNLRDRFEVATSPRRPLNDTYELNRNLGH